MDTTIKVLIADDHPLILQGLRRTLEACEDIEVVGEARAGNEVPALVQRRAPDVVLLDLRMPGLEDRVAIEAAIEAGASGYVLKSVNALDVPAVVRQVAAGYSMFHTPAKGSPGEGPDDAGRPSLTAREATILEAVAGGKTTKAISGELWVSEHTVKFHLTNIYRKLGVSNRSGAVRYAYEHGLLAGRD